MMKKFFVMAAMLLALAACGGKDNPDPTPDPETKLDVTGCWELSGVTTKVSVGSVNVNVYIEFVSGGSFTLYQKLGEGRYTVFTGTYALSADAKLSGTYTGGASWGPYTAALNGSNLTLTPAGGKEVDTYKKISSIPTDVTSNVY